ncbi:MAG: T9SS type A sorting domain-containing protein, partial [Bacteroidota bacterium]
IESPNPLQVEVFTVHGQRLIQSTVVNQLDVSQLPKGLYYFRMIRINTGDVYVGNFIKAD